MGSVFDAVFADGYVTGFVEGYVLGFAQGLAEADKGSGRTVGRKPTQAMLVHQTKLKFGPEAANRLDAILANVDDPRRFVESGGLLMIDNADGEEFLSCAASSVERR